MGKNPGRIAVQSRHSSIRDDSLFEDTDFPHDRRSLGNGVRLGFEPSWIPARYVHPSQDMHLFDGIEPNDLLQGQLGDCWLVAAAASLAEFPNAVRKIFEYTPEITPDGNYSLKLFDHKTDKFIEVLVDEFIPCNGEGKPVFAHPHGNEIWVPLLEKAVAKLFGSYSNLIGGFAGTAFRTFTGEKNIFLWRKGSGSWRKLRLCPHQLYEFICTDEYHKHLAFFHIMQKADQSNFMSGASIVGGNAYRPDGLVEGHAYSVLHVTEVEGVKLVCLRNPWGNDREWNGDWSDKSDMWDRYPNVKARLRPRFEDDGCFWMSWHDFCRVWDQVEVCCKAMRTGGDAIKHKQASKTGHVVMERARKKTASHRLVKQSIPTKRHVAPMQRHVAAGKREPAPMPFHCCKRRKLK